MMPMKAMMLGKQQMFEKYLNSDLFIICVIFACMRVNHIGDIVNCIIQYDSMLTTICKCDSQTLNQIILTCGGVDHLNELYLREADI